VHLPPEGNSAAKCEISCIGDESNFARNGQINPKILKIKGIGCNALAADLPISYAVAFQVKNGGSPH
jgi:hypothetical protein